MLLLLALVGASAGGVDSARAKPASPARFRQFEGALPVLLYHRLAGGGGDNVAPADFAAQMRRLHELGFEAVTLDQYVRFVRGEQVDLPQRPVLITFDDGYLSSWQNADPVLARYDWSAAMYVPTAAVGRTGHLTWDELRRMQASGRWAIDEHAGHGHKLVTAGAGGRRLPFYASELWAGGTQESFSSYRKRVSGDIDGGLAALARNLPGWSSHGTFAVPFNNYGQNGSNDPRIEPWLVGFLETRFPVVFVQRDDNFSRPVPGLANRIAVSSRWDADTLEQHLLHGLDLLEAPGGRPPGAPVVGGDSTPRRPASVRHAYAGPPTKRVPSSRATGRARFARYRGAVPTLLYHRLVAGSVSPAVFEAQMRRLHELGFEAVTLDQFVRFVRGEPVDLPERPILITFDDAFLSSWKTADPVLARYGWTAAMYVPTALVGVPGRMTWAELRQMQSSGRWQIDEHAGAGHALITVDRFGRRAPFYANAVWAAGKHEGFAAYQRRVRRDIDRGSVLLAHNLPGWRSHGSFAVPFGDYGQDGSNDARIEPWLTGYLESRFSVVLAGNGDAYTTAGAPLAGRIRVSRDWDADVLETHLLRGLELLAGATAGQDARTSARATARSRSRR